MKGELGEDLLGAEGAGIFPFIEQFDPADADTVVIEVELFGVIDGVADFDALADIGGGDLIEGTFETDGGVVIDHSFVAEEEDFIEFGPGEAADGDAAGGGVIAVHGALADAGVDFMVVVFLEPETEGLVQFFQGEALLEARQESFADRPEKPFDLAAGGAVVGFGVDEGDAGQGAAAGQ